MAQPLKLALHERMSYETPCKMAAADVVLDLVSRYLDQDPCVSEVNCCGNCLKLKNYLKVVSMELKSAQQIIRILNAEKVRM
jgi:hypothetical protein